MKLKELYRKLRSIHGPVGKWWPGTPEEIVVTAILTQNTNWKNVERAMKNLKDTLSGSDLLKQLFLLPTERIAKLIRPAGFFNVKAERLKALLEFLKEYDFNLERLKRMPTDTLRELLLKIKGIGKETADAILLYALEKPIFVVDSYTKRLLVRIFNIELKDYDDIQKLFMSHYSPDVHLYQKLHGLIVEHAKKFCSKAPKCARCPLRKECLHASQMNGLS
ncbi:endonuclease III domain-containing protein [Thermotoga sp.]|uniref:endonuclease III domain-containing protein n=1 Tax=Thermotoga sp. TaxID=28240 RepID=UPI0025E320B4|nr:endonuclease III domain-containing protein [Thermotoga sp.]MCD6550673.1 endonuclease III domain-containing protein [Thermotoga sp.]